MRPRRIVLALLVLALAAPALHTSATPSAATSPLFSVTPARTLYQRAIDFVAPVGGEASTRGFSITCQGNAEIPVQATSSRPEFIVTPAFTTVYCGSINIPAVSFQPQRAGVITATSTIGSSLGATSFTLRGNGVPQTQAFFYTVDLGPKT